MNKYEQIMSIVKQNNGVITSKTIDEMGIHRQYLSLLVQRGKLEKTERGLYISVDAFDDKFLSLQTGFKKGIYSHNTALYLHQLTDRTPLKLSMTFPASYNTTNAKNYGIKTYRTNQKFYSVGIVDAFTVNNHLVKVYNVERTLCDIVRGNSKMNKEEVVNAFKEYSKRKNKDLTLLFEYAKLLKVEDKIRRIIEVLV